MQHCYYAFRLVTCVACSNTEQAFHTHAANPFTNTTVHHHLCLSLVVINRTGCLNCRDTLNALGGHYVLNSGTFLGPSKLLLTYIDAMLEELQQRWHCRRLHGSDQAIHNFLVYTGKFIGTGMLYLKLEVAMQSPVLVLGCCPLPLLPP